MKSFRLCGLLQLGKKAPRASIPCGLKRRSGSAPHLAPWIYMNPLRNLAVSVQPIKPKTQTATPSASLLPTSEPNSHSKYNTCWRESQAKKLKIVALWVGIYGNVRDNFRLPCCCGGTVPVSVRWSILIFSLASRATAGFHTNTQPTH